MPASICIYKLFSNTGISFAYNNLGVALVLPIRFEQHGEILPELNKDRLERPLRNDLSLVSLGETLSRFDTFGLTTRAGCKFSLSSTPFEFVLKLSFK